MLLLKLAIYDQLSSGTEETFTLATRNDDNHSAGQKELRNKVGFLVNLDREEMKSSVI